MASIRLMTPLSPELIDSIIDYCHSHQETLMACSLVSKRWNPASRYHLFSVVTISHDNAREFLELYNSPACTITTTVVGLVIHLVPGSQRWFGEFSRRLTHVSSSTITSLTLTGTGGAIIREETQSTIISFYNDITHLTLGPLAFSAFTEFACILDGLPALEFLSSAVAFHTIGPLQSNIPFVSALQSLTILASIQHVLGYLLDQAILPTLSSLTLSSVTLEDFSTIARYLQKSNDSLSSLSIEVACSFSGALEETFMESVDLSQLTELQELYVETVPPISPEHTFILLSKMTSVSLECIKVSAALAQGIARVDIFLSGARFPCLRAVAILGASWADARQFLPRCYANGILKEV